MKSLRLFNLRPRRLGHVGREWPGQSDENHPRLRRKRAAAGPRADQAELQPSVDFRLGPVQRAGHGEGRESGRRPIDRSAQ